MKFALGPPTGQSPLSGGLLRANMSRLPQIEHVYQNHHLDSTRWDHFTPRAGDIVIATPIKSGTTWTQAIVLHLIAQDRQQRDIWRNSLWLDWRGDPLANVLGALEAQ